MTAKSKHTFVPGDKVFYRSGWVGVVLSKLPSGSYEVMSAGGRVLTLKPVELKKA